MQTQAPKWLQSAVDVLMEHQATRQPLKKIVEKVERARHLDKRERGLLADHVFGVMRDFVRIKEHVEAYSKTVGGRKASISEEVRAYLWLFSGEVRKLSSFLTPYFEELQELGARQSFAFPPWFIQALQEAYGFEHEALCEALSSRADPVLAVDQRFVSTQEIKEHLKQAGIESVSSRLYPKALKIKTPHFKLSLLPEKLQKHLWLMDDASQYAASCIRAKEGQRVLDMCAGGGGKTRFLLQTGADLTAVDLSKARIKAAQKRIAGKERVSFIVKDARDLDFAQGSFDAVLLDAPCSGTGILRREPDRMLRLREEEIEPLSQLQAVLLEKAFSLVKKGGQLVYVTCSVLPQENTEIVEAFLKKEPRAALKHQRQLLPSTEGCDGFFVAELSKK